MISIKVLGSGCANCQKVESIAREAVKDSGLEAEIEKVTDYAAIHAFHIMSTPGLVVNDKLVCSGRIPRKDEVIAWINQVA